MKRFKIHALETVEKETGTSNAKYYDTVEEARMNCKLYLRNQASSRFPTTAGFVIFEAIETVTFNTPPIDVTDLRTGERV